MDDYFFPYCILDLAEFRIRLNLTHIYDKIKEIIDLLLEFFSTVVLNWLCDYKGKLLFWSSEQKIVFLERKWNGINSSFTYNISRGPFLWLVSVVSV